MARNKKEITILNKQRKLDQSGFTLIELLLVISIIALLSSLLMVSAKNARDSARIARVKADFHQIRKGMDLLVADTGKWPNGCPAEAKDSPEIALDSPLAGLLTAPGIRPTSYINGNYAVTKWTQDYADVSTVPNHLWNAGIGFPGAAVNTAGAKFDSTWSTDNLTKCGWVLEDISKWRGPYINNALDPWGHAYIVDTDYQVNGVNQLALFSRGVAGGNYVPYGLTHSAAPAPNDIYILLTGQCTLNC